MDILRLVRYLGENVLLICTSLSLLITNNIPYFVLRQRETEEEEKEGGEEKITINEQNRIHRTRRGQCHILISGDQNVSRFGVLETGPTRDTFWPRINV